MLVGSANILPWWLGPFEGNLYANDVPPRFEDMIQDHPSHVTLSTCVATNVGNLNQLEKAIFGIGKLLVMVCQKL
jgi:hypothetical protein